MKSTLAIVAAAPLAVAQTLCGQYDNAASNGYIVNNNAWGQASGSGSECTYIDSYPTAGIAWHADWNWSGGDTEVKGYPNSGVVIETQKLVSNIGSIPTKAEWNYSGDNIRADVSYDLFTASDPNHVTSSGDYELMIWLSSKGGITPIGSSTGTVTVDGNTFDLWYGYNGAMQVYSFLATTEITSFDSDVKQFYDHITDNNGFPASSQYLLTAQFGTEPFTGQNAAFDVYYWYAVIN
ncbi:endoglucanase [Xylariaceae sp. FL1019]|nr:endoglucanase [Xylariaceae sp. FL1019]